jgi:hypothetical protein
MLFLLRYFPQQAGERAAFVAGERHRHFGLRRDDASTHDIAPGRGIGNRGLCFHGGITVLRARNQSFQASRSDARTIEDISVIANILLAREHRVQISVVPALIV